jgi:hypothetical protein|tara:strand:- start:764 stop:1264 length:501 start_codon:yes stop_codon:yes gene_type:complete
MALLTSSSAIYANSSVKAINTTAKAAGFSHQTVKPFFKVNGRGLTAHNRSFSMDVDILSKNMVLASGMSRRYQIRTPEKFSLSFTYLPGSSSMTVDGDEARDYMYSLVALDKNVLIEYLPDHTSSQTDFDYKTTLARITSYSETLIRRDEVGRCYYYDVSIEFEGL